MIRLTLFYDYSALLILSYETFIRDFTTESNKVSHPMQYL